MRSSWRALLLSAALSGAHAVALPEPTAMPARVEMLAPVVTPSAIRFDGRYSYVERRNIVSDIASGVNGVAKSWASVLGSALPSYFTDGACHAPADQGRFADTL